MQALTLLYTAISRKVVGRNVHKTIPKGNMGYDQYTVPGFVAVEPTFVAFLSALANICPWPLVSFFQIPLKNSELKTTQNTLQDCRMHFFRQPFSKQLYTIFGRKGIPFAYLPLKNGTNFTSLLNNSKSLKREVVLSIA